MRESFTKIWLAAAFAFVGLLAAAPAAAEVATLPTDGIRFGAFSIHPSLYTAMRYNDNVYFVANNYQPENRRAIPQSIEGDFIYNVTPAVLFDVSAAGFTARAGYRYYNDMYLGYDDPDNRHDRLDATNHTFSGLLDYDAPFGLMVGASDDYSLMETYESTEQFVDYLRGDQKHNDGRGWLGFRSGPYDSIYFKATYINLIDEYKKFEDYNKMSQLADGVLRLKFFPSTAVIVQGGYGIVDYSKIQAFDSTAWYALGGLQGQITNHLLILVKGGWEMADYQENEDFAGWLAQAELTAIFAGPVEWAVGYQRFFRDAADTNYYTSHEGYTRLLWMIGTRLRTTGYGSYQYNDFSEPVARHEDFIQAEIDASYALVYWLWAGGGDKLEYLVYDDDEVRETTTRNLIVVHLQAQF